jgi:multidrug resistance efflux pump
MGWRDVCIHKPDRMPADDPHKPFEDAVARLDAYRDKYRGKHLRSFLEALHAHDAPAAPGDVDLKPAPAVEVTPPPPKEIPPQPSREETPLPITFPITVEPVRPPLVLEPSSSAPLPAQRSVTFAPAGPLRLRLAAGEQPAAVIVRSRIPALPPAIGRYLLAAVLIVSGVTVALLLFQRPDTGASPAMTAPSARPNIVAGIIRPAAETTVSVDVAVRIQDVLVEPRQTVTRGQPLFVVDDRDARAALAGARLEMEKARLQVKNLEAAVGALDRRIKQPAAPEAAPSPHPREPSERAQVAYEQALLRLQRLRDLHEEGAVTQQDVDGAEMEVRVARENLEVVADADASRGGQRAQLAHATERRARARRAAELRRARTRLERAAASVAALNERATMSRIDAPADGNVIEVRVSRGDLVMPGTILARLADLTNLVAEVQVPSADVPRLRRGGKAEVTISGDASRREPGTIRSIEPTPGPSGTHRVVIAFEPSNGVALSGQAANVTFPGT